MRDLFRFLWILAPGLAMGPGIVACGPALQATYECDVHFEHCYALDETVAAASDKQRCWHEWLTGYTFGQPRDRVEYASSRVKALSAPQGTLMDDPPPDAASHAVAAPLPTNAFAPPPPVASSAQPDPSPPAVAAPQPSSKGAPVSRMPGAECAQSCEDRWTECRDGCRGATCAGCDRSYRSCMPACFR